MRDTGQRSWRPASAEPTPETLRPVLWAWAMFGQPMSAYTWVGLVLCLIGVYLARGERTVAPALTAEKA